MGIYWIGPGNWEDLLLLPSPAQPRDRVLGLTAECVPQSQRAVLQLKGRVSELEAELAEQRHLRQQAADDSEFLRAELDELKKKREDTEKAQRSLTEIESESVRLGWEPQSHARLMGKDGAGRQSLSPASVQKNHLEGPWCHQLEGWVGAHTGESPTGSECGDRNQEVTVGYLSGGRGIQRRAGLKPKHTKCAELRRHESVLRSEFGGGGFYRQLSIGFLRAKRVSAFVKRKKGVLGTLAYGKAGTGSQQG